MVANRVSAEAVGETLAAIGVIVSMLFVGMQLRSSVIEDSTAPSERFACRVDLQALRDTTILGNRK